MCSVKGCTKKHYGYGWCQMHLRRWRKYGDPLGSAKKTPEQRFWEKVDRGDPAGCWLWTGEKNQRGHGRFYINRETRYAYRVAYELLVGPIPAGLQIDHLCRVPACVNPAHLEPVTPRENALRGEGPTAVNARKTHCKRGHEFTPETMYLYRGMRRCTQCKR